MSGEAEAFVADHPRSVMITRRRDDGLQASPVRVLLDGDGQITAVTSAKNAKALNLARDPRVTICVIDTEWSGPWMTIEGRAEIVRLPEALPALAAFYEQRDGIAAPADEFAARMESEQRVLLRITAERATPPPSWH